jgi:hypothetical protein
MGSRSNGRVFQPLRRHNGRGQEAKAHSGRTAAVAPVSDARRVSTASRKRSLVQARLRRPAAGVPIPQCMYRIDSAAVYRPCSGNAAPWVSTSMICRLILDAFDDALVQRGRPSPLGSPVLMKFAK